jgi:hypothetical protein
MPGYYYTFNLRILTNSAILEMDSLRRKPTALRRFIPQKPDGASQNG